MNRLKASIIIPTFNRLESLGRCLDSLAEQTFKNFEVIIAYAGSTDAVVRLASEYSSMFPAKCVLGGKGLVCDMNKGLDIASGDIVIRIDDDVVASKNWLLEIVSIFDSSDKVGGVTGPAIIPKDRLESRDLAMILLRIEAGSSTFWRLVGKIYLDYLMEGEYFWPEKVFRSGAISVSSGFLQCLQIQGPIESDTLAACNMALLRSLVQRVGGFDERFKGTSEYHEPDLCMRVRSLGYKMIFNPKAIVYHNISQAGYYLATTATLKFHKERMWNFIYFYTKNIRLNKFDKIIRFLTYVIMLNGYHFYKFAQEGNIREFGSILGTIQALWFLTIRQRIRRSS